MKYYFHPKQSKYIRVFFEKNVYHPGDTVRGYVEVVTKKKVKVRGVRIHYGGYEKTEWTEGSDDSSTTYRQTIEYFEGRETLWGNKKGSNDTPVYIEPGTHKWAWKPFTLPPNLPPSFYSIKGKIGYWMRAYLDIPFGFNKECVEMMNVFPHAIVPSFVPEPLVYRKTKLFFGSSIKKSILINVTPRTRILQPGGVLPLDLYIKNDNEKHSINSIKVSLNKFVTFRAHTHTTSSSSTDAKYTVRGPPIKGSKKTEPFLKPLSETKVSLAFQLPPFLCISNFPSQLIHVRYKLQLSFVTSGATQNEKVNIPDIVVIPGTAQYIPNDNPDQSLTAWNGDPLALYPRTPIQTQYLQPTTQTTTPYAPPLYPELGKPIITDTKKDPLAMSYLLPPLPEYYEPPTNLPPPSYQEAVASQLETSASSDFFFTTPGTKFDLYQPTITPYDNLESKDFSSEIENDFVMVSENVNEGTGLLPPPEVTIATSTTSTQPTNSDTPGKLVVVVIGARDVKGVLQLRDFEGLPTSSPKCTIKIIDRNNYEVKKYHTSTQSTTTVPTWNQSFKISLPDLNSFKLYVGVRHKVFWRKDIELGEVMLDLKQLNLQNFQAHDFWTPIYIDGAPAGEVHLSLTWKPK